MMKQTELKKQWLEQLEGLGIKLHILQNTANAVHDVMFMMELDRYEGAIREVMVQVCALEDSIKGMFLWIKQQEEMTGEPPMQEILEAMGRETKYLEQLLEHLVKVHQNYSEEAIQSVCISALFGVVCQLHFMEVDYDAELEQVKSMWKKPHGMH